MGNPGFFPIHVGRIRDTDRIPGRRLQHAFIAGLPAGGGIEDRGIGYDSARVRHSRYGGAAFLEVRVLAKQTIGGHVLIFGPTVIAAAVRLVEMVPSGSIAAPATPVPEAASPAGTQD